VRKRPSDFALSPDLKAAAEAMLGVSDDISIALAMRKPEVRAQLREEQFRRLMGAKLRHQALPSSDGETPSRSGRRDSGNETPRMKETTKMDMQKYGGDQYLKVEDLRISGPVQATIEAVEDGPFDKPVAVLSDGSSVQLNITNTRTLIKAWGRDSAAWVGREVKLSIEQVDYKGEPTDSIVVRPISAAIPIGERKPPPPAEEPPPPTDDDIRF